MHSCNGSATTLRICVVVTARPSYSRVRSLLRALQARPEVELQLVVAASALLERYGNVSKIIEQEFPIAARIYSVYEGENTQTTVKSTAALLAELSAAFGTLRPDAVVVHADRYEVLAAAQAASYQGYRLVHLQGGEHTGSIDQRVRHAITQLADLHCVSTPLAQAQVMIMRYPHRPQVHVTGCPSIDECVGVEQDPPVTVQELGGAGAAIDLGKPFLILLQHPTTENWESAHAEMVATLEACGEVGLPTICLWPGNEAGAGGASKAIRGRPWLHTVRNVPPRRFLRLLGQSACVAGNSSVSIREAGFLGVPAVNIGDRQIHRERSSNVLDVAAFDSKQIAAAIAQQVRHGRYPSSGLYGDGKSGERMADVICEYVTARNHSSSRR
jgi:UDP-hydrolysing UDP-N-acetyl-D-glucosamine 2-epimerase